METPSRIRKPRTGGIGATRLMGRLEMDPRAWPRVFGSVDSRVLKERRTPSRCRPTWKPMRRSFRTHGLVGHGSQGFALGWYAMSRWDMGNPGLMTPPPRWVGACGAPPRTAAEQGRARPSSGSDHPSLPSRKARKSLLPRASLRGGSDPAEPPEPQRSRVGPGRALEAIILQPRRAKRESPSFPELPCEAGPTLRSPPEPQRSRVGLDRALEAIIPPFPRAKRESLSFPELPCEAGPTLRSPPNRSGAGSGPAELWKRSSLPSLAQSAKAPPSPSFPARRVRPCGAH